MRAIFLLPFIFLASASCGAPPKNSLECIDLTKSNSKASVSGKLTVQLFAGAPNYESIASGDAEERTFILELSERMCAFGDESLDPEASFDRVQISGANEGIGQVLDAAVGRKVTISGDAYGAHTGHHHAPLVLTAQEVSVK